MKKKIEEGTPTEQIEVEFNLGQSDMVCSMHLGDGELSLKNPYPTVNFGYEKAPKQPRRKLIR